MTSRFCETQIELQALRHAFPEHFQALAFAPLDKQDAEECPKDEFLEEPALLVCSHPLTVFPVVDNMASYNAVDSFWWIVRG